MRVQSMLWVSDGPAFCGFAAGFGAAVAVVPAAGAGARVGLVAAGEALGESFAFPVTGAPDGAGLTSGGVDGRAGAAGAPLGCAEAVIVGDAEGADLRLSPEP